MTRRLVVFGLSITSAWNNGHAATYRGLLGALAGRGWEIVFFERDVEWYRTTRDLPNPGWCEVRLYQDWSSVRDDAEAAVRGADAVMVGSYAGEGEAIVDWVASQDRPRFFYDIDTPITLTALEQAGRAEYLRADQVPIFDVYFSFTGGPALRELEQRWGARRAEALYCCVDAEIYRPVDADERFACQLGYMGSYAPDRQPKLEELLIEPARRRPGDRFLIAGDQYPPMDLPTNVGRIAHVPPGDHAAFYASNGAALNLTRAAMVRYGWSPSVRLFEAALCGACIISDAWPGLDELLRPGDEILIASTCDDVLGHLDSLSEQRRRAIATAARERVLAEHTHAHRAAQFEAVADDVLAGRGRTEMVAGQGSFGRSAPSG